jgi:hypothetical protein
MSQVIAKCFLCKKEDGKHIYVSRVEPKSKLVCGSCLLDDNYELSHDYDPLVDNYHLGLTKEEPSEFCYMNGKHYITCFECKEQILTDKMGIGKIWLNNNNHRIIYYCLECYKKHNYKCVNFRET